MLFENTARVPLIIHDPSQAGQMRTTELAELIDVYPTLAALAGLPAPADIDGTDLSSLWNASASASTVPLKKAAFSQYPRCPTEHEDVAHHTCLE